MYIAFFPCLSMQEVAGLKADDLPYVPPFDINEDAPPESSMAPTGMKNLNFFCAWLAGNLQGSLLDGYW